MAMHEKYSIYLDYAAATPVDADVQKAMEPYWSTNFGNPSSIHSFGQEARDAVDKARLTIAHILNCSYEEIIFTGSGTESILLALQGAATANPDKKHLVTTQIEHPAVLATTEQLIRAGYQVTYLPVDGAGLVHLPDLEKAIQVDTALISIMYANNEIGTIQPIRELSAIAKRHHVPFHTDACQAAGALDIDVKELGIDLMTINGSKLYGPKGIGLLYVSKNAHLVPVMPGGGQEQGRRGGTENVPGIIGLARALELADQRKSTESKRLTALRDQLIKGLVSIPQCRLNGHQTMRLPNNVHVSFTDLDGQTIVGLLNQEGIACSSSSACASLSPEPSHVMMAIGHSYNEAFEGIRFSLGRYTKSADIDHTLATIKKVISDVAESHITI